MASINEELAAFPVLRPPYTHAVGMILQSPRTGIVYVPFDCRGRHWACVVVQGTGEYYQVGGHNLLISDDEAIRSPRVELALKLMPTEETT